MKKQYIEPSTTVVRMDTEHAILDYSTDGNMIAALSFEDWDTGSELDF